MTARLDGSQPIVEADGRMTQRFRSFMNDVYQQFVILGDGSPEGVVTAPLYSEYVDRTGSSGSIKYIKMTEQIAGDRSQGWVLL